MRMTNLGLLIACAVATVIATAASALAGQATIEGKWCLTAIGTSSVRCFAGGDRQITRVGHSWFVTVLRSAGPAVAPDKADVLDADDHSIAFVEHDSTSPGSGWRYVCQLTDGGAHLACQQTGFGAGEYSGPTTYSRAP